MNTNIKLEKSPTFLIAEDEYEIIYNGEKYKYNDEIKLINNPLYQNLNTYYINGKEYLYYKNKLYKKE